MIIVDFLSLQMPGMLDRLSITITYQKIGGKEISISFKESIDWQNKNHPPVVGFDVLPREIILPGLLWISFSFTF